MRGCVSQFLKLATWRLLCVSKVCLSRSSVGPQVFPSFVEFDMTPEGFGCLFLPSIAPQSVGGSSVVTSALSNAEINVIGGIGSGKLMKRSSLGPHYGVWNKESYEES